MLDTNLELAKASFRDTPSTHTAADLLIVALWAWRAREITDVVFDDLVGDVAGWLHNT